MREKSLIVAVFILMFTIGFSGCVQTPSENNNNQHPNEQVYVGNGSDADFQNIQDAINAVNDGSTIYVQEGTYYETIYINKSIHLIHVGEHISSIIGGKDQSSVIQVNADYCTLDGFDITKNGTIIAKGIHIRSSNNTISNNTITDTTEGIVIENETQQNTIIWNNISNNHYGLKMQTSVNNTLAYNIVNSNSLYGMYIYYNSHRNIIHNNTFYKNNYALRIKSSAENIVYYNCFNNNTYGVYLCCGADYNIVYNNIFKLSNQSHIHVDRGLTNYFTDRTYGGNYYDDYDGVDSNNDSFGDTPYLIKDSTLQDDKPLMNPLDFLFCDTLN
jgi:parallel beta-helix repeat protein